MNVSLNILVPVVASIASFIIKTLLGDFSEETARLFLFGGKIGEEYKSKEGLEKIVDRYQESMADLNRSLGLNISFVVLALYAYFLLPATSSVNIPILELSVSRHFWISIVPVISYGLQIYVFTSFIWFMLLRLSIKIIRKDINSDNRTSDFFTDILLKGTLGHMWILFRIRGILNSKLNYIWYIPILVLIIVIATSPVLICLFFIIQLFASSEILLGVLYSVALIPCFALFIILLGTAAILAIGEKEEAAELREKMQSAIPNPETIKVLTNVISALK